jgi:hypothetical protein
MNNGLSDRLKAEFPNTKPVPRPIVHFTAIQHPNWLSGFTEGEGCFMLKIRQSTTHKLGIQAELRFQIGQHSRDKEL